MSLPLLPFSPVPQGYGEEPRAASTMYMVEGGRPRGRLVMDAPASTVSVTWRLLAGPYAQFMAFYRAVVENQPGRPQPFEVDLVLDSPERTRYVAQFLPGTLKLEGIYGGTYTVSARLEVEPAEGAGPDDDYDDAIVMLFDAYGSSDGAADILELLAELVNGDHLPEA